MITPYGVQSSVIYLCASSPLPRGYDVFSGAAPGAPPGDHKRVMQVKITWMCARSSLMVYGAMANRAVQKLSHFVRASHTNG